MLQDIDRRHKDLLDELQRLELGIQGISLEIISFKKASL